MIVVGIGREIIENTILWKLGVKYENRRDSFINAFFDVILVIIGSLAIWLMKWIMIDIIGELGRWFYLSAIILFVLFLSAYFIRFFITNEATKKSRKDIGKVIS
ncbi:hypothetical protein LCGC14_1366040 [marine sediment metagenome]|uniref:Uncharacterized protein n=1 Tax=marine sediment metagenome TaxID=412755 RepID=A0A0F9K7A2_9ZZZZ